MVEHEAAEDGSSGNTEVARGVDPRARQLRADCSTADGATLKQGGDGSEGRTPQAAQDKDPDDGPGCCTDPSHAERDYDQHDDGGPARSSIQQGGAAPESDESGDPED